MHLALGTLFTYASQLLTRKGLEGERIRLQDL